MSRIIKVEPQGRLGNQMLQYMVADNIRSAVPGSVITGFGKARYCNNILKWGIDVAECEDEPAPEIVLDTHRIDIPSAIDFLNSKQDAKVICRSVSCRYEYYAANLDRYRKIFSLPPARKIGADKILVNVRLEDALAGIHPFYPVLPISWCDSIIEESGLEPVFVGQFSDDPYSAALRAKYPESEFFHSSDPLEDFNMLRGASHIVLPVSTFSWLAAWLSEFAEQIHMPIAGIFNPWNRPDINLLPLGDSRYQFHFFPNAIWKGSEDEVGEIISGAHKSNSISHEDAAKKFKMEWPSKSSS